MRHHRTIALAVAGSLAGGLLIAAAPGGSAATGAAGTLASSSAPPTPPAWLEVRHGEAQPQFDLDEAITQTVFVQTSVDSDLDGRRDRVRVQISRPGETRTRGLKVPVVFEQSPYRYRVGGGVNHDVDYSVLPQESIRPGDRPLPPSGSPVTRAAPDLPGSLDDYWVPRGFAVILGESIGTGYSDGCPTSGDERETLATRAVIDWVNGRASATDAQGRPVRAGWSTGDVGMTGVSYNGTLPNMVATTGVEGLRTIVPISAIANWYDYYRANGLVRAPHSATSGEGENDYLGEDLDVLASFVAGPTRVEKCRHVIDEMLAEQDRITGDVNAYWRERDYLPRADRVRASVFVVHGLEDYNVMSKAYSSWWHRLAAAGVPRKIWLHNGGHGGPSGEASSNRFQAAVNRWMTHWLFGVRNGVMAEPRASIQRPDGHYDTYADWPAPDATPTVLRLGATSASEPGTLSSNPPAGGPRPRQSFVDRGRVENTDEVLLPDPDRARDDRLVYLTPPLADPARISGTPRVTLRTSIDNRYAANLTAVLVDYGPVGSRRDPVMITRGWADLQNRDSLARSRPIQQGREYTLTWPLQPDDAIVPAGHRLGLLIASTDQEYTLRPAPGTRITVDPSRSTLTLPLVGG